MEKDHGQEPGAPADESAGDRVGVTEAAQRLGIDKGTVSRQVNKWGIRKDAEGKFSYAAYLQAREQLLNPLMDRTGEGDQADEDEGPVAGQPPASPLAGGGAKASPLQAAHASQKLWAAKKAQLEYEEKVGAVCERHGAVEAGERTGQQLQDLLRDRRRRIAEEAAGLTDPAEIEALLDREDGELCRVLEETMKRLLNVVEGGDVAAA